MYGRFWRLKFDCIYEQSVNPLEIACNADVHMVKSGLNEMLPCDTLSPTPAKRPECPQ